MNKAVAGQQRAKSHGQGYNLPASYPTRTPHSALSPIFNDSTWVLHTRDDGNTHIRLDFGFLMLVATPAPPVGWWCTHTHTHTPRAGSRKHLIYAGNAFAFLVTAKDGQQEGQNRIAVISAYLVLWPCAFCPHDPLRKPSLR